MTTEQAIRYFEGFKSEIPELIQEQHALYDDTDDFDMEMREQSEATDLALFALRSQQWISVKDRLPERPPDYFKEGHWWMVSGEDFIVADADGKVYEAHWTYGCSANNYFWYVNSLTPLKNITHWMPLPEPPKEAQK